MNAHNRLIAFSMLGFSTMAYASSDVVNAYAIDNFFLFMCAVLVLFMQAGFALLESGLNSAKNTVNILFKNIIDLSAGALLFYVVGYSLMYPVDGNGIIAFSGFGYIGESSEAGAGVLNPQVNWLFQVAFAATAATIVSGAVAGRMKFSAYLIYSVVLTGLIYPISGYWKWGGGWLDALGFYDFAGSLVVHALGGFAGLAGALVLGPRVGRFKKNGGSKAMPGHSLTISTLGVFILWIGWYGFNPGSQLAIVGVDNTNMVMHIAVNTTLAAAAGGVTAMILAWWLFKKPDLSMALNGILAGLVGITAGCDSVTNGESIIIGLIAGLLVVLAILFLEKMRIDDPVGAWPVHGVAGVWGGLATGIFGDHSLVAQLIGSIVIPLWGFLTMYGLFGLLKAFNLLRVSETEEIRGLDISEHQEEAYAGFQIFTAE
jgi:Amt family ammonium transporter